MTTANGSKLANTVTSGGRTVRRSAVTQTGRRIDMELGVGCRRLAGHGSTTSLGAGRHTTMDVGSGMPDIGIGRRMAIRVIAEVGGHRHS